MTANAEGIQLRHLQPSHTAAVATVVPCDDAAEAVTAVFAEVCDYLDEAAVEPLLAFARFTPMGRDIHVIAGFTVASPIDGRGRVKPGVLPGGEAVVCVYTGAYEDVAEAYRELGNWMVREGRVPASPPWEVYLSPIEEQPPRTEVVFVLEPRWAESVNRGP